MPDPDSTGGNVYDKYASRHPIERRLVGGFLDDLHELVDASGAQEAHEVGCGEGELTLRLARRGLRMRGSDASESVVAEARRRAGDAGVPVDFKACQIEELRPGEDSAELIVCCEVLEHLQEPEAGLAALAELARPWLIVSVPREPIWRVLNLARRKYIRDFGNTPGHLNHWSSRAFLSFLAGRFDVRATRRPLPWTMALCRVRG